MNGITRRITLAGTFVLALAGCESKTVTAQNASTAEVAQKVKESGIVKDNFISPGQWRMTMTINDMNIPGMPPEMATRMKSAMGEAKTFEHCVTEEEAKKPKEDFFSGSKDAACRYDNFTMGGGKMSMVMQCNQQTGKQTVRMDGTYGPDSYHITMASAMEGKPGSPVGGMTFNATMDAKRTGVCTGKDEGKVAP